MNQLNMTSELDRRLEILRAAELRVPLTLEFWEKAAEDQLEKVDPADDPQKSLEDLLLAWLRPESEVHQAETMNALFELSNRLQDHPLSEDVELLLELTSEAIFDHPRNDVESPDNSTHRRLIRERYPDPSAAEQIDRERSERSDRQNER